MHKKLPTKKPASEIIFIVDDAPEGGYTAKALGESIFTEATDAAKLRYSVRDAIRCHFDKKVSPNIIRLFFVRDEILAV